MDGASDGAANIWVKSGGTMNILDSSEIKSANDKNYTFWVDAGSAFEMKDSTINRCGTEGPTEKNRGLYVQADNAKIENNVFGENYYCLFLTNTRSASISKNSFNGCSIKPLIIRYSTSPVILSNNFASGKLGQYSVELDSSLDAIISNNTFDNQLALLLDKTNSSSIEGNVFSYGRIDSDTITVGYGADT
ncbi:hypothetical protein COU36_01790, partial [Candidatus Micrarchaeota archaeon CG10_big_fil_rev_8_21_14_0_10_59_7]